MNKFFELGLFGAAGAAAFTVAFVAAGPADTNAPTAVNAAAVHEHQNNLQAAGLPGCIESATQSMLIDPDTPKEDIEALRLQLQQFMYGEDGARARPVDGWSGANGNNITLTYSFPDDGLSVSNCFGQGTTNEIHARLNAIYGNEATWKNIVQEEFDRWSDVTGITYTEVSDDNAFWGAPGPRNGGANRGDIRIVMGDNGGPSGVLACNSFPDNGDMFLDTDENWGFGTFFRNVLTHEHGHGLGLAHVCPDDDDSIGGFPILMKPFIDTSFLGPQVDDFIGGQNIYGDQFEPNGSGVGSVDLPALGLTNTGSPVVVDNMSIRNVSDTDIFRVPSLGGTTMSLTVLPVGGDPYDETGQFGGGGSGCSGVTLNSLDPEAVGDLSFQILNPNFVPVATIDNTGAGSFETVSGFELTTEGDWFVSVNSETSFPGDEVQLYRLTISTSGGGSPANPGDLTGDGCVSSADLGVLLSAWGSTTAPNVDVDNDGVVGSGDLGIILSGWTGVPCD